MFILQIRLDLQESLYYRILSNSSQSVCVCSNEARSVRFNIVPKKLREIPLTVIAKDVNSSVCDEGIEQMVLGVTDAVTRKLLVEVRVWLMLERTRLWCIQIQWLATTVKQHVLICFLCQKKELKSDQLPVLLRLTFYLPMISKIISQEGNFSLCGVCWCSCLHSRLVLHTLKCSQAQLLHRRVWNVI